MHAISHRCALCSVLFYDVLQAVDKKYRRVTHAVVHHERVWQDLDREVQGLPAMQAQVDAITVDLGRVLTRNHLRTGSRLMQQMPMFVMLLRAERVCRKMEVLDNVYDLLCASRNHRAVEGMLRDAGLEALRLKQLAATQVATRTAELQQTAAQVEQQRLADRTRALEEEFKAAMIAYVSGSKPGGSPAVGAGGAGAGAGTASTAVSSSADQGDAVDDSSRARKRSGSKHKNKSKGDRKSRDMGDVAAAVTPALAAGDRAVSDGSAVVDDFFIDTGVPPTLEHNAELEAFLADAPDAGPPAADDAAVADAPDGKVDTDTAAGAAAAIVDHVDSPSSLSPSPPQAVDETNDSGKTKPTRGKGNKKR